MRTLSLGTNQLRAEGISHATGLEDGIRIAGWLSEIVGPVGTTMEAIERQETGFVIPIDACTDCRGFFDTISSPMEPKPADTSCIFWFRWI